MNLFSISDRLDDPSALQRVEQEEVVVRRVLVGDDLDDLLAKNAAHDRRNGAQLREEQGQQVGVQLSLGEGELFRDGGEEPREEGEVGGLRDGLWGAALAGVELVKNLEWTGSCRIERGMLNILNRRT